MSVATPPDIPPTPQPPARPGRRWWIFAAVTACVVLAVLGATVWTPLNAFLATLVPLLTLLHATAQGRRTQRR